MSWQRSVQEEGFAVFADVLEPAGLDRLISSMDLPADNSSRAGIRHLMLNPAVAGLAHGWRLLSIAQQVLGIEAFPFRATLFGKSPRSNWLIPWHQDTALPLQRRQSTPGWGPWSIKQGVTYAHAPARALKQVLALRLHLDDCTTENGPLRVLPGTHKLGLLNDNRVSQLSSERAPVECVVPKGGVLAMRPLLVHASSKSRSPEPRRVLHVEYAAQSFGEGLELAVV